MRVLVLQAPHGGKDPSDLLKLLLPLGLQSLSAQMVAELPEQDLVGRGVCGHLVEHILHPLRFIQTGQEEEPHIDGLANRLGIGLGVGDQDLAAGAA